MSELRRGAEQCCFGPMPAPSAGVFPGGPRAGHLENSIGQTLPPVNKSPLGRSMGRSCPGGFGPPTKKEKARRLASPPGAGLKADVLPAGPNTDFRLYFAIHGINTINFIKNN